MALLLECNSDHQIKVFSTFRAYLKVIKITSNPPFNMSFLFCGSKFDGEGRTQGLWATLCPPPNSYVEILFLSNSE